MKNNALNFFAVTCGVITVSLALCYGILAWNEPTAAPPTPNASAPVNTGTATQNKSGGLNISGNVGIGTIAPATKLSITGGTTAGSGFGLRSADVWTVLRNYTTTNNAAIDVTSGGSESTIGSTGYNLLINPSGGNVGIGTTSPTQKLDVSGNLVIGDASGPVRMTLFPAPSTDQTNPLTGTTNRQHFHYSFQNLNAGIEPLIETPSDIWAIGSNHNIIADGYVKGGTGVCIGGDCRTAWPGGISAQSCPSGQAMIGMDGSGNIICSGNGMNPFSTPCTASIGAGNKKVFVTSSTYSANAVQTETAADSACQTVASAGGLTGTYKALVYMGNRDPFGAGVVLKQSQTFWNCQKNGTTGNWNMVALTPNDFLKDHGGGVYLNAPIRYDERGLDQNGLGVWTGFQPTGGGNYNLLNPGYACFSYYQDTYAWKGACAYRGSHWYNSGANVVTGGITWFGISGYQSTNWAYNVWAESTVNGSSGNCPGTYGSTYDQRPWTDCFNSTRAFYCVEQ